jgi:hypothetical protein
MVKPPLNQKSKEKPHGSGIITFKAITSNAAGVQNRVNGHTLYGFLVYSMLLFM